MIFRITLLLIGTAIAACAQLSTIASKNFLQSPPDWSFWVGNGSPTQGSSGFTSTSNGSLIYGGAVPANYEVRTTYRFTAMAAAISRISVHRQTPTLRRIPEHSTP